MVVGDAFTVDGDGQGTLDSNRFGGHRCGSYRPHCLDCQKKGLSLMKRVFGWIELGFDTLYLFSALIIGGFLLINADGEIVRYLAGIMVLVLVFGDAFHLVPRILVILFDHESDLRHALGRGKQITSISMTLFYLLLWQIGVLVYQTDGHFFWTALLISLAILRIGLCLMPQNRWTERYPPRRWGIYRNIPFFLMGVLVAGLYFMHRSRIPELSGMGIAIALSFVFYLPVVVWSNRYPKVGMLMLPKTCAYLWIVVMCCSL